MKENKKKNKVIGLLETLGIINITIAIAYMLYTAISGYALQPQELMACFYGITSGAFFIVFSAILTIA